MHNHSSLRHITAHPKMFPFAHNHNSLRIPLHILNLPFVHNHNSLRLVRKSDCKSLYCNLQLIRELPRSFASGSLAAAAKTGMPRLTITNHSELYPGVLNSLNKNASNEMSEYLVHDKIRKQGMKQARRNHSVFPCSSANFLSRGLLSCPGASQLSRK